MATDPTEAEANTASDTRLASNILTASSTTSPPDEATNTRDRAGPEEAADRPLPESATSGDSVAELLDSARLLCERGALPEAIEPLERLLAIAPHHAIALNRLGAIHQHLGQLSRAEAILKRAVNADPELAPAWCNLGIVHLLQGDAPGSLAAARSALEKALAIEPGSALTLQALSQVLQRQGDLLAALDPLCQLVALEPQRWTELLCLGHSLQAGGHRNEAEVAYRSAHSASGKTAVRPILDGGRPAIAVLQSNLASVLAPQGQLRLAQHHLNAALNQCPELFEAEVNLSQVLLQLEDHEGALAAADRAIALNPSLAAAHTARGLALRRLGRHEMALEALNLAISLDPGCSDHRGHLALCLHDLGRLNEALENYNLLLAHQHDAITQTNIGICRLLLSQCREGWDDYEARLENQAASLVPRPGGTRWRGEVIGDAPMLLIGEQGIGDMLQFVRFAPAVKQRFGSVELCVYPELVELLSLAGLADAVHAPEAGASHQGPWLPLMSVCHALGATPEQLSPTTPYLCLPRERAAHWEARLRRSGERLIGLHWQGNPASERGENWGRSFPLALFEPLSQLGGVRFVSLQKGTGMEQLQSCSFRSAFIDNQDEVDQTWDFLDTAAIASCCDLLISSDSGVVHLAGGLGLPVWVLLKHVPDWRWGLEGERSSWYPTARLFRQPQPGDWDAVIEQVARVLPETLATT